MKLIQLGVFVVFFIKISIVFAANQVIDLRPGDNFEKAVEALEAGDTLIVHEGTYSGVGRIGITVQGTEAQPVIIRSAEGEGRPLITRPAGKRVQNTINIEGATYLTIQGLEITGNGGDAVRVNGPTCHHIVLQDLLIHDVDVGINTKNNSHNFIIRGNHIYDTGFNNGTGEGMYIGCHKGDCSLSDSIIENNLIHDTLPGTTQGDGIEIKVNSQNILIRNNVIYNRPYPGIFVYGGGAENIVEGNVVWGCLEGIAAVSDAVVRNNIVFDNEFGFVSNHHAAVPVMENTTLVNNTLYNNGTGILLRWNDASNMKLANNAIYSQGQVAIDSYSCITEHEVVANVTLGEIKNLPSCSTENKRFKSGRSADQDFIDVSGRDFWPTTSSPLIAAADVSLQPHTDFNDNLRVLSAEVGAYAYDGRSSNPGWPISETFKDPVVSEATTVVSPKAGLWWNPQISGHGVDIQLAASVLSIVWYTYDQAGKPVWYIGRGAFFGGQQWQADLELYSWNGSKADYTRAGQVSLDFSDQTQGTFSWTLDGVSDSESIEYFVTSNEAVSGVDYTGTWYEPAQPDYGMSVSIQGTTESSILYFYDDSGAPVWALGSNRTSEDSYRLKTYQGFCPNCDPVALTNQDIGSITPRFDCEAEGALSVDVTLAAPLSGSWQVSGAQIKNLASERTTCSQ